MVRFLPTKRRLAILGILGLSMALRGVGLLSRSLNYEEALCWFYARIPLSVQLRRDIRGPLNYVPLAPLALLSPRPEFVRLLPFAAGAASSLLPFYIRRLPLGAQVGAAAFLALCPPLVRQSQDADGCSLGFLFEGLALLLAASYALGGGFWRAAGHGLFSLLSSQTHAAFGWSLLGRGALFALLSRRSRRARALFLSCLPGVVGILLDFLLFKPPPLKGGLDRAFAALLLVLVEPSTGYLTGLRDVAWAPILWPFGLLAFAIIACGGLMLWREGLWGRLLAASGASAALLFVLAVGVKGLAPLPRYLLPMLFPVACCFGAGLRGGSRWALAIVLAAQLLGSGAYLRRPYYGVDWREAARVLEAKVRPGEPVVLHPPAAGLMLRHYLKKRLDLRPRGVHWFTAKGFFVGPEGRVFRPDWRAEALRAAKGRKAVWVLLWSLNPKGRMPPRRLNGLELRRVFRVRGYAEAATVARYLSRARGRR